MVTAARRREAASRLIVAFAKGHCQYPGITPAARSIARTRRADGLGTRRAPSSPW